MIHSLLSAFLILGPMDIEWTALPDGQISVECAGDVNGDGTEDCFSASSEDNGAGVFCIDGLTGEILWQTDFIPGVWNTECLRTIGDVNLDGIQDLAAGTTLPNSVTVFSGVNGEVIWSSSQEYPVKYIERATGPSPGDAVVLVLTKLGTDWLIFNGLDGLTGEQVWNNTYSNSSLDEWIKVTDADINGNGWSEMGCSIDRGGAMSGYTTVRDGYTGELLYFSSAMYYPRMGLSDSPLPCVAVCHYGDAPDLWVDDLTSATTVWSIDYVTFPAYHLDFIPNVTGSGSPYPELIAWGDTYATFIIGDNGSYVDSYVFPAPIVALDDFEDTQTIRITALTEYSLHCPVLAQTTPPTEPSINLPSSPGTDFCLLESDQFPTPLVCVSMNGSGPGVCAVRTSWQVQVDENHTEPIQETPSISLASVPSTGGITVISSKPVELVLVNISGRVVDEVALTGSDELFIELPPGVYHLVERSTGMSLQRAIVLD